MSKRLTKTFTCVAASLSVIVLSTRLGAAEDGPQMKMDFVEMLSTFQKRVETNMDEACSKVKEGDPTPWTCQLWQMRKESSSSSQKKETETTNSNK